MTATPEEREGAVAQMKGLPDGVYVPMLTFFKPAPAPEGAAGQEEDPEALDLAEVQRQAARLHQAGVAGLVVHGSNGEAAHLTHEERVAVIQAVVSAIREESDSLDASAPTHSFPIIAGCGAQSVRETLAYCREAAAAGATHALVLPPGYYAGLLGGEKTRAFFTDVADRSPIPLLIYNFPAAANGVDLDSDTIIALAAHPNIVGVKLTCGNTGKLARVAAGVRKLKQASRRDFHFSVFGGSADFILQGAVVGAHGTISGLANLAPRACVRILALFREGRLDEACDLQQAVAEADWLAIQTGFVGVKYGLPRFMEDAGSQHHSPPSILPRRPCRMLSDADKVRFDEGTARLLELEHSLAGRR